MQSKTIQPAVYMYVYVYIRIHTAKLCLIVKLGLIQYSY